MLQLAWLLDNKSYELQAYQHISLSYFYKQNIERASFYQSRVSRGLVEATTSGPMQTGTRLRRNRQEMKGYDPDGKPVRTNTIIARYTYHEDHDQIALPEAYRKIRLILNSNQNASHAQIAHDATQLMIGDTIFRPATPLDEIRPADLPSPSMNKRDQKVMPNITLLNFENPFINAFDSVRGTEPSEERQDK